MGASPDTINGRVMESFGSTRWPEPFLPTDASINGAKGRVMKLEAATAIKTITALAKAAVEKDSQAAADALLQAVRVGFSVFDYINDPEVSARWNLVRRQVYTQLGYIEQVFGVQNLQAWWLLFTADWFTLVGDRARTWADQAITAAAAPLIEAQQAGRQLIFAAAIRSTLDQWLGSELDLMFLPDSSSMGSITLPPPP